MDFSKFIVVSGKSGIFKIVAQSRSGFITESLIDGKKMPIQASNRITSIDDIVVFTESDEIKLREVFKKIKEITKGEPAIDHKSDDKTIVAFFSSVLPEYDKEKVYVSDMRKIIFWYNLLQKNNILNFDETTEDSENSESSDNKDSENPAQQES